ncbi:hypothetical protein [Pelagibius marinus]|uniref:hypothetical protein n=1 Tax=Pelagibius marinus TaxID=2762760 RepID=UPI001872C7DE|nr:hypothetical protein [Pelagibius marinus]
MTSAEGMLAALSALLERAAGSAYSRQSIPSDLDTAIGEALARLPSCDDADRALVAEGIAGDHARGLKLFAERMASLAVRKHDPGPLKTGLAALLIAARSEDDREVLLVLSLLHDAAIKVAGSAEALFVEAGSLFGQAELLDGFLRRADKDKRIQVMGYEESETEDGFLYVRSW